MLAASGALPGAFLVANGNEPPTRRKGTGRVHGRDLALRSSRACLHTAFIAISVLHVFDWPANGPLAYGSPPDQPWFGLETQGAGGGGGGGSG